MTTFRLSPDYINFTVSQETLRIEDIYDRLDAAAIDMDIEFSVTRGEAYVVTDTKTGEIAYYDGMLPLNVMIFHAFMDILHMRAGKMRGAWRLSVFTIPKRRHF